MSHEIFPSVIRSHARMTYKSVNAILEAHDEKTRQEYKELVPMFETMADLHRILLKHRHQRGQLTSKPRKRRSSSTRMVTQPTSNYATAGCRNG